MAYISTDPSKIIFLAKIRATFYSCCLKTWHCFKSFPATMRNSSCSFQVWVAAASQVFFSSGVGWGAIITLSSFQKFHHNAHRYFQYMCILCIWSVSIGLLKRMFFYGMMYFSCIEEALTMRFCILRTIDFNEEIASSVVATRGHTKFIWFNKILPCGKCLNRWKRFSLFRLNSALL